VQSTLPLPVIYSHTPSQNDAGCRYHFRRAREINPRNSGLDAQLGTILLEREKGANLDEARELLER
jgi:hypothetical protein